MPLKYILPRTQKQNLTKTRAIRWVGWRLFDIKEYIVFSKKALSFTMKIHSRIQKCMNTKIFI